MSNIVSDETIEYISILAKLELSEQDKDEVKRDMEKMLDYIDVLNQLDTKGVEPANHIFPVTNVFREDIITNGNNIEKTLANAPQIKDDQFVVPKTID